ncbi:MAG: ABC transporter substrate-binding protein, partial [Alphaproteobacteria bacterium]|nr:ABC transporter substrate-binding protein [Alphaproteobacteria bacterium]
MRRIVRALLGALPAGVLMLAPAFAAEPLKVFSLPAILESAPLLVAVEKMPANAAVSLSGGIPNLWEGERVSFPDLADVAGNAETQALRFSLKHPDLRLILTVAEGLYRVVGRRSAGISSLADLKGKRIATRTDTSAAYYLKSALAVAHLTEADVEII